jgi:hypothetical protein
MTSERDPVSALRHARVFDKAKTLFANGTYYWYHCGDVYGVYKKSGDNSPDTAYTVNLLTQTCTCPHFSTWREPCKHILGLEMELDRIAMEEQAEQEERLQHDGETATGCDPYARY